MTRIPRIYSTNPDSATQNIHLVLLLVSGYIFEVQVWKTPKTLVRFTSLLHFTMQYNLTPSNFVHFTLMINFALLLLSKLKFSQSLMGTCYPLWSMMLFEPCVGPTCGTPPPFSPHSGRLVQRKVEKRKGGQVWFGY